MGFPCWCIVVQSGVESAHGHSKQANPAERVPPRANRKEGARALTKTRQSSANRVLVELIETGLESKEAEKTRFFDLAERLTAATHSAERRRIKKQLARRTFGE